jgi:hypothetical protein
VSAAPAALALVATMSRDGCTAMRVNAVPATAPRRTREVLRIFREPFLAVEALSAVIACQASPDRVRGTM